MKLAVLPAAPSSSGVTRTGDSAEAGFDWTKPNPLASSAGMRLRSDTSLTRPTSRMWPSASSRDDAARHVAGDDDDLGLEVAAPGFVGERDRRARREHLVRAALIHERIGPEALGHLGAARLPDQLDVVHISRAVGPLIGARQRRVGLALVEAVLAGWCRGRDRSRATRSCGSILSQSSSAACRVGAIWPASAHQARSWLTTTSRPSRPRSAIRASFDLVPLAVTSRRNWHFPGGLARGSLTY